MDHQVVIHNTYHGGQIETDHHVICSMPEYVEKHFAFPNFTTSMSGTLMEFLDNYITQRDKVYLNGLGMTKCKYQSLSMMPKTGMEEAQEYTVLN